jgi:hypothetical protein
MAHMLTVTITYMQDFILVAEGTRIAIQCVM